MCNYGNEDEWTGEQLVYELAHQEQQEGDERDEETIQALIDECLFRELLVPCDDRGNGWRLADMDGVNLMPTKELVFAERRHGWVFWIASGRPHAARLHAFADPAVIDEDLAIDSDTPTLMLIDGGLSPQQKPDKPPGAEKLADYLRQGDLEAVRVILRLVEANTSIRLVAYLPESDEVVYGGALVDELVAQVEGEKANLEVPVD